MRHDYTGFIKKELAHVENYRSSLRFFEAANLKKHSVYKYAVS